MLTATKYVNVLTYSFILYAVLIGKKCLSLIIIIINVNMLTVDFYSYLLLKGTVTDTFGSKVQLSIFTQTLSL